MHPLARAILDEVTQRAPFVGEADAEDAVDQLDGTRPGEGYEPLDDQE